MTEVQESAVESSQLLSFSQAMKLLNVSRSTLNKLALRKVNPFPSVRIGKARRYPMDQAKVWIKNLGK